MERVWIPLWKGWGEMIVKALEEAGGVKAKAAEMLGISSGYLRYRLQKLGITHPSSF